MFNNGEIFPYTDFHRLNLDWIIATVKRIDTEASDILAKLTDLQNQISSNDVDIASINTQVQDIKKLLDEIKNGKFVDLYIDSIKAWLDANIADYVGRVCKYVFFGLSDDGHFIAQIPCSWDFIHFDTVVDTGTPLYGHLIMRW